MSEHLEHRCSRTGGPWQRHDYNRCAFSGAGNCCCGRPVESVLHPHEFTPAMPSTRRPGAAFVCVCNKPPNWQGHWSAPVLSGQPEADR